jgi:hypothetical protein
MEQGQADRSEAAATSKPCLVDPNEAAARETHPRSRAIQSRHRQQTARPRCRSNSRQPAGNRGRGRPKRAKNKTTIALEAARAQLDSANLSSKRRAMKEPKDILLESANYFWNRAQFLSNHARKLANEDATAASIDAIMDDALSNARHISTRDQRPNSGRRCGGVLCRALAGASVIERGMDRGM